MKKRLIGIFIAIAVGAIAAVAAHWFGVKSWETCLSAGAGVSFAEILRQQFRNKKAAITQNHN